MVNLTNNSAGDYEPAWSPDATKISFLSDRDGPLKIYVMDADGSNAVSWPAHSVRSSYSEQVWSPDGTKMAFVSDRDGNNEIYVMDVGGGNEIRLYFLEDRDD